jgi:cytochrome c553
MTNRAPRLSPTLCAVWLVCALVCAGCRAGSRAAASATTEISGEAAFRTRTCWRCHAIDRSGTEIGPPLQGLAQDWDVDSLSSYIDDPAPFRAREPRLQALVARYHGRLMKGFPMEREERRALAAWLLQDSH